MRYRDAAHVDLGSFHARLPAHGQVFRWLGLAGIGLALACAYYQAYRLEGLMVALLIAWVMAWYRGVGVLWRGHLVAAIAMVAVLLSIPRLAAAGLLPPLPLPPGAAP